MAPEPYVSPKVAAQHMGIPVATIYKWRSESGGPPCYKVGKHLRFRLSEVDAWVEATAVTT